MNKITITVEGTDEQMSAFVQALVPMAENLTDQGFKISEYEIASDQSWITISGKAE